MYNKETLWPFIKNDKKCQPTRSYRVPLKFVFRKYNLQCFEMQYIPIVLQSKSDKGMTYFNDDYVSYQICLPEHYNLMRCR